MANYLSEGKRKFVNGKSVQDENGNDVFIWAPLYIPESRCDVYTITITTDFIIINFILNVTSFMGSE